MSVGLTDELWSGVAVVAAPQVERSHHVDHGSYTLAVFVVPILLSSLLEAGVSLLSHVVPRRKVLNAALWVLGAGLLACALATTPWMLAFGLSVAGAASGVACGAAETALVARHADALDRTMARWMIAGGVGDILAPSVVALLIAYDGSYRLGFCVVLSWVAAQALSQRKFLTEPQAQNDAGDEQDSVSLREALRQSVRNRQLWLWLAGTALCTLLDELIAALSALRLRNELGASDARASASLIGYSCGIVLGALLTERLVPKVGYRRILIFSATCCLCALLNTIIATNVTWMTISLTVLGLTAAAHYPLLLARAYEAAPGQAAIVGAMAEVFVVFDLTLPWVLGELADAHGLQFALTCLMAQPVGVLTLTLLHRRKPNPARVAPDQA